MFIDHYMLNASSENIVFPMDDIMNNVERFSYESMNISRKRRLSPTTVKYYYKVDGIIEITFDVDRRMVMFFYVPEGKFILFTVKSFKAFLDYISDRSFLNGFDSTDYLPDDNISLQQWTDFNILCIRKAETRIYIYRSEILKIKVSILYDLLDKI